MNVVPQYKVIEPYNYDMIIHNKKYKIMLRDKMHLILKIKICVIR